MWDLLAPENIDFSLQLIRDAQKINWGTSAEALTHPLIFSVANVSFVMRWSSSSLRVKQPPRDASESLAIDQPFLD